SYHLRNHAVANWPNAFVVDDVALPKCAEVLNGVRVQPEGIHELCRSVAGHERREQRAFLGAHSALEDHLGSDRFGELLAEGRVVLVEDMLRARVVPHGPRELLAHELE